MGVCGKISVVLVLISLAVIYLWRPEQSSLPALKQSASADLNQSMSKVYQLSPMKSEKVVTKVVEGSFYKSWFFSEAKNTLTEVEKFEHELKKIIKNNDEYWTEIIKVKDGESLIYQVVVRN